MKLNTSRKIVKITFFRFFLNCQFALMFMFQAEEERLRKEEQEKREHEEYLALKAAFSVEEEGESELTADLDVSRLSWGLLGCHMI